MNNEALLKYVSASIFAIGLAKTYAGCDHYKREGDKGICSIEQQSDLEMVLESRRAAEHLLPGIALASMGFVTYGSFVIWDAIDRNKMRKRDSSNKK